VCRFSVFIRAFKHHLLVMKINTVCSLKYLYTLLPTSRSYSTILPHSTTCLHLTRSTIWASRQTLWITTRFHSSRRPPLDHLKGLLVPRPHCYPDILGLIAIQSPWASLPYLRDPKVDWSRDLSPKVTSTTGQSIAHFNSPISWTSSESRAWIFQNGCVTFPALSLVKSQPRLLTPSSSQTPPPPFKLAVSLMTTKSTLSSASWP